MLLSILTSAITGLAIALSAAPWDLFPFAFIALIPWLRYLNSNPSFSETLKSSLWTGFFMALGTFSWISFVLNSFGGVPWILAIPMTLLFAIGAEPQFVIFGLLRRLLKKSNFTASPILWAFSSAFLYTAIDFLVPKLFKDTLGHSLHSNLPFLQNAEWGGAHTLTFMLVFFNESAVQALQSKKIKQMIAPIALASALYSFGLIRLPQIQNYYLENGKSITVAGIQGNIGDFDKLAAEQGVRDAADRVMSIFRTMTNQALLQTPKADLVIWPETTYPSTFGLPYTQNKARYVYDKPVF